MVGSACVGLRMSLGRWFDGAGKLLLIRFYAFMLVTVLNVGIAQLCMEHSRMGGTRTVEIG